MSAATVTANTVGVEQAKALRACRFFIVSLIVGISFFKLWVGSLPRGSLPRIRGLRPCCRVIYVSVDVDRCCFVMLSGSGSPLKRTLYGFLPVGRSKIGLFPMKTPVREGNRTVSLEIFYGRGEKALFLGGSHRFPSAKACACSGGRPSPPRLLAGRVPGSGQIAP